jgi:AraC-like DNA-binding protein
VVDKDSIDGDWTAEIDAPRRGHRQREGRDDPLARTYRFAATVFAINPAGPIDWGDLAGGAGYFDQAHFGHEFRAFTGLTPTRYVEVRRRFLREHPGHALDGWPLPAD